MLWIQSLVSIKAKCRQNWPMTVRELLINLLKSPFCNGEGSGKVIQNLYPGPYHHQKLISSSDWMAQSQHEVSMRSAHHFCRNPAHRQTE